MEEIWKTIEQFPAYEISSVGRIRRRLPAKFNNAPVGKLLKFHLNCGYPKVRLCRNGKVYNCLVHRLVAFTFLGIPPHAHEVDHIDFDRSNCRVTNLRYVTKKQNKAHCMEFGRYYFGVRHHSAKLCPEDVLVIRMLLKHKYPIIRIAKFFGVARFVIQGISKGNIWKSVPFNVPPVS